MELPESFWFTVNYFEPSYDAKVKHPLKSTKRPEKIAAGELQCWRFSMFIFELLRVQTYELKSLLYTSDFKPHSMKTLKVLAAFSVTLLMCLTAYSQVKSRKLSNVISHPSYNTYAPYISADATSIVFVSDNAEDNAQVPFYTMRANSDWMEPIALPKHIYTRLGFSKGYALSADGKRLFFTTLKTPGVGGFDIWTSDLKGTSWGQPVNLGMPVNSRGNEACPSVTTDGNTMYFMRCDKMDQSKAESCKLFVVKKKLNEQWGEPEELPASINTGNSQTPRIMADGETLIFSSDKMPGNKGGMDLYMAKVTEGNWSAPKALDYVNTPQDDQYVTVAALGRYLIRDTKGARKNEIVEYLIPNEMRPKGMMKIDGKATDASGAGVSSYVSIFDLNKNKRVYNGKPYSDGSFIVYIMEGSKYELSIDPEQDHLSYFSKQFDLMTDKIPQVEKVSTVIKPIAKGDEISLDGVAFKPGTSELDLRASSSVLKKFIRFVKGNPDAKFEIQVLFTGYSQDSVRSNADLTEVISDSVATTFDEIDSLGQLYKKDTVYVKTTFHNDRTWKQAKALVDYVVSQGAKPGNFSVFGNAIPAAVPEEKKLVVKARAK
jgi:hypothetical protein